MRSAGLAAAMIAALALASCSGDDPSPGGSTLAGTWVDPDGNGVLDRGRAEPLSERTELARAARPVRELGRLAVVSDAHVRDEESPARLPVLDRLGPPFESTFRPQEALAPHVLSAAVRALGPERPDAVLVAGDLVDNAQRNELDQARAALEGGTVRPDSGRPGYHGPQETSNPDPAFYRPDVDAPRRPRLLEAAQRPFRAPGLRAPWYPVAGNHDLLFQGELPATPALDAVARGGRRVVELDPKARAQAEGRRLTPDLADRVLARGLPGETVATPPDPARHLLSAAEAVSELAEAGGRRVPGSAATGRLDYAFDVGARLRVLVLDTVRRQGGSAGQVAPEQVEWLRRELRRAGSRLVLVAAHQPLDAAAGADDLLALLDADPRVIAMLHGHTHAARVAPRSTPAGGMWTIGTPSLADHPQQARMLRIVETEGRGVALETWMVDHASAPGDLAGTARELAYLDAQGGRPKRSSGRASDRNARLFLPPR